MSPLQLLESDLIHLYYLISLLAEFLDSVSFHSIFNTDLRNLIKTYNKYQYFTQNPLE